ncbi:hypothetical protein GCM10023219_29730 [Stakelama sediminis]|uniref:ATP-binding protein n=1 Tax=Stakelama sediminis TaxID=463200 RepID=UPI0031EBA371
MLAAALLLAVTCPASASVPTGLPKAISERIAAAEQLMVANPAKVFEQAQGIEKDALSVADARARAVTQATALWLQADALLRMDREAEARPKIDRALQLLQPLTGYEKLKADLNLTRGNAQNMAGNAAEALNSFHEAHQAYQRLGDRRSESIALQNIAALYSVANDNSQAEKYYRQAGEVYNDGAIISLTQENNLGGVLLQLDRYKDASNEFEKALALARKLGSKPLIARILGNLARSKVEDGELKSAEPYLNEALSLSKGNESVSRRQQLLATKARISYMSGDITAALRWINEAFSGVDIKDTSVQYRYAHYYAYKIYSAAGQPKLALEHLEALKRLNDESAKVASSSNAALAAARFDYQRQELRIAQLKAQELRRNVTYERARSRFQRIIFISIGAAALLVLALLSFALVTLRRSRNRVRAANLNLEASNAALEKALHAKTEFLATTSHEIRTPLNGILGMTQVMLADKALSEPIRERIGVVNGAGLTMRALVDDILDVAKMETGNLTVESISFDLPQVLTEVSRIWEEQARGRGIGFVLDIADDVPQWIEGDPARLRQIVFNLLANALKFTERGEIRLRAFLRSEGEAQRLCVAVSDTGIGIPADKQEEIFESFKQVDTSTTRKYGGTGLGLAICRNLAQALGGNIEVKSVPGSGSTFIIALPVRRSAAPDAQEVRVDSFCRNSILVLERNPIARSMLKTLIGPRVEILRFAESVKDAIHILDQQGFGCLLIDQGSVEGEAEGAFSALEGLASAAARTQSNVALMWKAPDEKTGAAIANAGIVNVIEKPVAGAILTQRLFGSLDGAGNPPLVSQAA